MTPTTRTSSVGRKIYMTFARFTQKAIKFVFKTIAAAILAAIILAIILPPAAFAFRSALPLNDPLFNGLSFYQVIQLRDSQYRVSVARYNAVHPNNKFPTPPQVCSWIEVANSLTGALQAEVCTLAKCSGLAVVPTSLGEYPATIWANFEENLVYDFIHAPQQPAVACRLPTSFP